MLEEYISKLRPIVSKLFSEDFSGHDIGHLERTMKTALYLQEKEGGDRLIIGIAAFLHDVHRIMPNEQRSFVSPKDSLPMVRNILSNIDLTEEQVNKICHCVEYHEMYNWDGNNVDDINTLIVQDADNLDAIGAIGIGRGFLYAGCYNVKMYDDRIPIDEEKTFSVAEGNDESVIHFFYHNSFRLENNMNTKTAKELAKRKTEVMREFTKEFLNEWNANY